jgi:hypothetical protein
MNCAIHFNVKEHKMTNKELVKLINKTPVKVRATIAGTDAYVNIEKQDFKEMLMEQPEVTMFEVEVNHKAIYVEAIFN